MEGRTTFSKFYRQVNSICDAALAEGDERFSKVPLRFRDRANLMMK